jgi:putative hydrolase of the HAD superfamily
MGGVIVRDHVIWQELMAYLGLPDQNLFENDACLRETLLRHIRGEICENDLWSLYTEITGRTIPLCETEHLLGKFFHPKMNEPIVQIVQQLKATGMRVTVGTNVIDAHYNIHKKLGQYDIFDKVYASHLMGIAKPDKTFYAYILKAEGIKAQDAFFTDDTIENVNAAANAGINAFHCASAQALKNQLRSLGLLK